MPATPGTKARSQRQGSDANRQAANRRERHLSTNSPEVDGAKGGRAAVDHLVGHHSDRRMSGVGTESLTLGQCLTNLLLGQAGTKCFR
jgi:hypothetical protein